MNRRHVRRPQKSKKRRIATEQERGIIGVRRKLSPESHGFIADALSRLDTEIGGAGRLFVPASIAVTVVGFKRFDRKHRESGPPTNEITSNIESCGFTLPVVLGKMGVYGGGNKHKLAFELHSEDMVDEMMACEIGFRDKGFPLRKHPEAPHVLLPHMSVALLYQDHVEHFRTPKVLEHLNATARVLGKSAILLPVNPD